MSSFPTILHNSKIGTSPFKNIEIKQGTTTKNVKYANNGTSNGSIYYDTFDSVSYIQNPVPVISVSSETANQIKPVGETISCSLTGYTQYFVLKGASGKYYGAYPAGYSGTKQTIKENTDGTTTAPYSSTSFITAYSWKLYKDDTLNTTQTTANASFVIPAAGTTTHTWKVELTITTAHTYYNADGTATTETKTGTVSKELTQANPIKTRGDWSLTLGSISAIPAYTGANGSREASQPVTLTVKPQRTITYASGSTVTEYVNSSGKGTVTGDTICSATAALALTSSITAGTTPTGTSINASNKCAVTNTTFSGNTYTITLKIPYNGYKIAETTVVTDNGSETPLTSLGLNLTYAGGQTTANIALRTTYSASSAVTYSISISFKNTGNTVLASASKSATQNGETAHAATYSIPQLSSSTGVTISNSNYAFTFTVPSNKGAITQWVSCGFYNSTAASATLITSIDASTSKTVYFIGASAYDRAATTQVARNVTVAKTDSAQIDNAACIGTVSFSQTFTNTQAGDTTSHLDNGSHAVGTVSVTLSGLSGVSGTTQTLTNGPICKNSSCTEYYIAVSVSSTAGKETFNRWTYDIINVTQPSAFGSNATVAKSSVTLVTKVSYTASPWSSGTGKATSGSINNTATLSVTPKADVEYTRNPGALMYSDNVASDTEQTTAQIKTLCTYAATLSDTTWTIACSGTRATNSYAWSVATGTTTTAYNNTGDVQAYTAVVRMSSEAGTNQYKYICAYYTDAAGNTNYTYKTSRDSTGSTYLPGIVGLGQAAHATQYIKPSNVSSSNANCTPTLSTTLTNNTYQLTTKWSSNAGGTWWAPYVDSAYINKTSNTDAAYTSAALGKNDIIAYARVTVYDIQHRAATADRTSTLTLTAPSGTGLSNYTLAVKQNKDTGANNAGTRASEATCNVSLKTSMVANMGSGVSTVTLSGTKTQITGISNTFTFGHATITADKATYVKDSLAYVLAPTVTKAEIGLGETTTVTAGNAYYNTSITLGSTKYYKVQATATLGSYSSNAESMIYNQEAKSSTDLGLPTYIKEPAGYLITYIGNSATYTVSSIINSGVSYSTGESFTATATHSLPNNENETLSIANNNVTIAYNDTKWHSIGAVCTHTFTGGAPKYMHILSSIITGKGDLISSYSATTVKIKPQAAKATEYYKPSLGKTTNTDGGHLSAYISSFDSTNHTYYIRYSSNTVLTNSSSTTYNNGTISKIYSDEACTTAISNTLPTTIGYAYANVTSYYRITHTQATALQASFNISHGSKTSTLTITQTPDTAPSASTTYFAPTLSSNKTSYMGVTRVGTSTKPTKYKLNVAKRNAAVVANYSDAFTASSITPLGSASSPNADGTTLTITYTLERTYTYNVGATESVTLTLERPTETNGTYIVNIAGKTQGNMTVNTPGSPVLHYKRIPYNANFTSSYSTLLTGGTMPDWESKSSITNGSTMPANAVEYAKSTYGTFAFNALGIENSNINDVEITENITTSGHVTNVTVKKNITQFTLDLSTISDTLYANTIISSYLAYDGQTIKTSTVNTYVSSRYEQNQVSNVYTGPITLVWTSGQEQGYIGSNHTYLNMGNGISGSASGSGISSGSGSGAITLNRPEYINTTNADSLQFTIMPPTTSEYRKITGLNKYKYTTSGNTWNIDIYTDTTVSNNLGIQYNKSLVSAFIDYKQDSNHDRLIDVIAYFTWYRPAFTLEVTGASKNSCKISTYTTNNTSGSYSGGTGYSISINPGNGSGQLSQINMIRITYTGSPKPSNIGLQYTESNTEVTYTHIICDGFNPNLTGEIQCTYTF